MDDGFRLTRQRKVILAILDAADAPLTAEEIAENPAARSARMALSTIYRNLERLCAMDVVNQFRFQDGIARYERHNRQHHHYLICTACQACLVIDDCPMQQLQQELEASTGFQITGHHLNLYGLCPRCRAAQNLPV